MQSIDNAALRQTIAQANDQTLLESAETLEMRAGPAV